MYLIVEPRNGLGLLQQRVDLTGDTFILTQDPSRLPKPSRELSLESRQDGSGKAGFYPYTLRRFVSYFWSPKLCTTLGASGDLELL